MSDECHFNSLRECWDAYQEVCTEVQKLRDAFPDTRSIVIRAQEALSIITETKAVPGGAERLHLLRGTAKQGKRGKS